MIVMLMALARNWGVERVERDDEPCVLGLGFFGFGRRGPRLLGWLWAVEGFEKIGPFQEFTKPARARAWLVWRAARPFCSSSLDRHVEELANMPLIRSELVAMTASCLDASSQSCRHRHRHHMECVKTGDLFWADKKDQPLGGLLSRMAETGSTRRICSEATPGSRGRDRA